MKLLAQMRLQTHEWRETSQHFYIGWNISYSVNLFKKIYPSGVYCKNDFQGTMGGYNVPDQSPACLNIHYR